MSDTVRAGDASARPDPERPVPRPPATVRRAAAPPALGGAVGAQSATVLEAGDVGGDGSGDGTTAAVTKAVKSAKRRWWGLIRKVVSVGLLAIGIYVVVDKRGEVSKAFAGLRHPNWLWLGVAVIFQASSMIVFARLQRWLLRCGGIKVRLRDMVEITLAGNALSTSIPGGAAWAAGWIWGQLRRRSVDKVLAGWVVLVAGALASFALFLYVVAGAFLAGSEGPVAPLRWIGIALLALAIGGLAGAIAILRSEALRVRWAAAVAAADGAGGVRAKVVRGLNSFATQVRVVNPSPFAWVEALLLALWNWAADLATLVFTVFAVHGHVPWRGVVIAYALTQIAASIPITPGGLAVVEASLTALLTAYGMPATEAVTVVLLYRIISFWALVPIGWASWGYLEYAGRSHPHRHHPWAFHVHPHLPHLPHPHLLHHDPAPEPTAEPSPAVAARRAGPERVRRVEDCVGCASGSDGSALASSPAP